MLSRDELLAVRPASPGTVDVPAWGGTVALRHLTLAELLDWQAASAAGSNGTLRLVLLAVADASGARLFRDGDEGWLAQQPGMVVTAVAAAAIAHNGLNAAATEAAAGN